jgi:hypothetical protein
MTHDIFYNCCISNIITKTNELKTIGVFKIPYKESLSRNKKNGKIPYTFNKNFSDSNGTNFIVKFHSSDMNILFTGFSIKLFDELKNLSNSSLCEYFSAIPFSQLGLSKFNKIFNS